MGQPIDIDELRFALEEVLSDYFSSRQPIKKLRRRHSVYSSSYAIQNLRVERANGCALQLILKDLSPGSLLPTARKIRPHFIYEAKREIETYRKLLHPQRLGTPICYGATDSGLSGNCWLFLERVNGPLLWQMGRMSAWEDAARWLARLHTEFDTNRNPLPPGRFAHLLRYDEALFRIWLARAEEFLRHRNTESTRPLLRAFNRLAGRYEQVLKRLMQLPTSFIHGEFYPSNVILRDTGRRRSICPVDWEVAAIGPGLIDLAALTSGDWTASDQKKIAAAYRNAFDWPTGEVLSLPDLMEAVAYCQLHLCIQLLGWAPEWSPPERHTQNWLQQALRLAKSVGL